MTQVPTSSATNTNTLTPAMQQQLEQLRDIHLPEPVSWFPMAIGWWVLIVLVILALIFIYRRVQAHRRFYKNPVYVSALDELSQLKANASNGSVNQNAKLAGDLSALLKRVGLYHNLPVASLSGDAWANYLTQNKTSQKVSLDATTQDATTQNATTQDKKQPTSFSQSQANFIAHGAYMDFSNHQQSIPDWQSLEASARHWITEQFRQSAKQPKNQNQRKQTQKEVS